MALERTKPSTTAVIVVDVQEKLVPTMPADQLEQLLRATRILLGAAGELGARVIATEQYPKGLGHTIGPVNDELGKLGVVPIEKVAFSGCREPAFVAALTAVSTAVVLGLEAHICGFQ